MFRDNFWYFFKEALEKVISKKQGVTVDQIYRVHHFVKLFVVTFNTHLVLFILIIIASNNCDLLNQSVIWDVILFELFLFFCDRWINLFLTHKLIFLLDKSQIHQLFLYFLYMRFFPVWYLIIERLDINFVEFRIINAWNFCENMHSLRRIIFLLKFLFYLNILSISFVFFVIFNYPL